MPDIRPPTNAAAVLLAGGRGKRMAGATDDKILARLGREPVFAHSLRAFVSAGVVDRFVVVFRNPAQRAKLQDCFQRSVARTFPVAWVRGGLERQDSVGRALEALLKTSGADYVFIHDCARPLVRPELICELDVVMRRDGAACLAHRITDTIKSAPQPGEAPRRKRLRTLDRDKLWAAETPQAFQLSMIAQAYAEVKKRKLTITDDLSALELVTRHPVSLVENPAPNPKMTRPADLAYATFLLKRS